jgi:hypothetical protein
LKKKRSEAIKLRMDWEESMGGERSGGRGAGREDEKAGNKGF